MTFINVLQNPSSVVPSLSDDEMYTVVVDSIRAYIENEINFETFVDTIIKLKLFSGIKENTSEDVITALAILSNLSRKRNTHEISTTLTEALTVLAPK